MLDSYHDERHPVGAEVVRATTVLTDVGTASGPSALVRDAVLLVAGHVRRVRDTAATTMAELTVTYRDSALSVQHGRPGHGVARAGDHAPDPVGPVRPDGTPVAVEELLARPGFLLLARTGDRGTLAALRDALGDLGTVLPVADGDTDDGDTDDGDTYDGLVDRDGVVARAYGLGPTGLALIRPDGYLGLLADAGDPELVARYVAEVLGVAAHSAV